MDDEKIIDLFFSRSEDAIVQLDRRYGDGCRRISSRILTDSRDAVSSAIPKEDAMPRTEAKIRRRISPTPAWSPLKKAPAE